MKINDRPWTESVKVLLLSACAGSAKSDFASRIIKGACKISKARKVKNDNDGSTSQECDKFRLLAWQNVTNILLPVRPSIEDSTLRTIAILKVEVGLA